MANEKIGRNDPCPCGSGRKYKHCCLRTANESEDHLWAKQREAHEQLYSSMLSYIDARFVDQLHAAWSEFNLGGAGGEIEETELPIFLPYFMFHWDPEFSSRRRGLVPGGVVAKAFLRDRGYTLSELQRTLVEQYINRPFSFHCVLASTPGERVMMEDVLTGVRFDVVERTASQKLLPGDLMYGAICSLPGITFLGGCAPILIPPDRMASAIDLRRRLRRRIAKKKRGLTEEDLFRYADDIRETYLDIRDSLYRPLQLANTDGDYVEMHTLTYRIESPEEAFRLLAPLAAVTQSPEELLEDAEFDSDGKLCKVEIPWVKEGNRQNETWDNTILGRLEIIGNSLIAEVNSAQRAERLFAEIENRLGASALHQHTLITTQEEMRRHAKEFAPESDRDHAQAQLLQDPEVRRTLRQSLQEAVDAWPHKRIPALRGRTPLQAVKDPDDREIVNSLLIGWERHLDRGHPEVRPDFGPIRRLLKLDPPNSD